MSGAVVGAVQPFIPKEPILIVPVIETSSIEWVRSIEVTRCLPHVFGLVGDGVVKEGVSWTGHHRFRRQTANVTAKNPTVIQATCKLL